jgi:hypothetical protein
MTMKTTNYWNEQRDVAIIVSDEFESRMSTTFEYADRKGRAIGVNVEFYTETLRDFTEAEGEAYNAKPVPGNYEQPEVLKGLRVYSMAPGVYYRMDTNATRGGKAFGPAFNCQRFATKAARDAAYAKYLKGAEKRAIKESQRA